MIPVIKRENNNDSITSQFGASKLYEWFHAYTLYIKHRHALLIVRHLNVTILSIL